MAALLVLALPRPSWAQFTYVTNNGAITITDYAGSGGYVTIPSAINGYPVTTIGTNAFLNQTTVTNVAIPNSVTSIGVSAFSGCEGLTDVTIGKNVTSVGDSAFWDCSGLTYMSIPSSVNSIGLDVFDYCFDLTNILVNPANPSYASAGGVLFNKALTTLVEYPAGLVGRYAIPGSVTRIGASAFSTCEGLTNVTIGNNVTSIGDYAFGDCSGLTYMTIPDSVTDIGDTAFSGCSLTNVTIGNSVTNIGAFAFSYSDGLTYVTIPSSVSTMGENVFCFCFGLTNILVSPMNPSYASAGGVLFNKALTTLVEYPQGLVGSYAIPDSVTSIGDFAFRICGLTNVTIPDSVTSIGAYAFADSDFLTYVTIPGSITSISAYAFQNCFGLTNATIPDSITSIGYGAFDSCYHLTSVTIPDSVTSMGDYAFSSCSGLTNVTIGKGVTNIGQYAFKYCISLPGAYFEANAPNVNGFDGSADNTVFSHAFGTVYYVPGTAGWGGTFGGWPTAQWYQPQPQILGAANNPIVQSNGFQFTISWATNTSVVVEASSNLQNWSPLTTNALVNGTRTLKDTAWTNYLQRFYRVRSQ